MRARWIVVLLGFALIAVSACADGDDPTPDPTTTPPSSTPTSETPTPSPTPEPAGEQVLRGAFETGFGHSGFYVDAECPVEDEDPYWVAWTPASDFAEQLEQQTGYPPFGGADTLVFRVTVRAALSPPGEYGHLGQYPREMTVSELIEAEFADDCGDDGQPAFEEPPPVTASVASGDEVELGVGTYCWQASSGVGICADSIGIITNVEAFTVASGATIFLSSQLVLADAEIDLAAWPVSLDDPIASGPDWLAWAPEGSTTELSVVAGDVGVAFDVDLAPGLYALNAFVVVPQGDVSYGLLLQVEGSGSGSDVLSLGELTAMTVGQTTTIEGSGDTLRFAGVVTDSRCPTDVQCVWAGEALLAFELTLDGTITARSVLAGSSGVLAPYRVTVQELAPEPKSTRPIPAADYVATIVVGQLTPLPAGAGIEGVVTLGPLCPVLRQGEPCPDRVHTATLILADVNGTEVDRVTSGEDGYYRLRVSPGQYTLMPQSPSGVPLPFAGPIEVEVTLDSWTTVDVPYDSGIR